LNDSGMVLPLLAEFDIDYVLLATQYTLLDQAVLTAELPACLARKVSVIAAGVFNSGILATGALDGAYYNYSPAGVEIRARVQRIDEICRRHGVPLHAAALQFPLGHPAVVSVLAGADSPVQVAANLSGFRHPIPAGLWTELKSAGLLAADAPVPQDERHAVV